MFNHLNKLIRHTISLFQWREISKILEGVIRIGAINCQDEWMMCNEQGIQAYPTLRIYPKVRNKFNKSNKFSFSFKA